jgi:hypothetical protein
MSEEIKVGLWLLAAAAVGAFVVFNLVGPRVY